MEGRIEYSSLVTLLANGLGLMENALVEQISRGRPYITVDHLRQGQLLKGGENTGIVMIYRGHKTEILLPNPGLGLYATNSLIVLPSRSAAVGRSASARIDRGFPTHYYGTDTTPQGPAHARYQTFDQAGSSRGFQAARNPWEQATPQHSGGSWQQARSGQCQQGNFDHSRQSSGRHSVDMSEASSRGTRVQPGRASFSGPTYHEQQMERREINTRLRGIDESQVQIQHTL